MKDHMNRSAAALFAAALMTVFSLGGCSYFDMDESSDYDKEDMFTSYTRAKQMVTNIYGYLPYDFCNVDGAMLDAATDDAVNIYQTSKLNRMTNGTWSPVNTADDKWATYYEGIRAANLYLAESGNIDFSDWEYTDGFDDILMEFEVYPYEVRFLRAYFYFELIRRYRNVPLVLKVLEQDEANHVKPNTFKEVAGFIVSECSEIADKLPVNYDGFATKEFGRITRGTALALKARMLLYMASPLYAETNDPELWKEAAKAAYAVMDPAAGLGYAIQANYRAMSLEANYSRTDIILYRSVGETGSFEKANFPITIEGGKTTTCPTDNLMEAYEFKKADGLYHPFSWDDDDAQVDPYANRDPRMEMTLVHNNQTWLQTTMQIWEGGAHGLPILNTTVTGYYLAKYVNHNISFASGSKVTKKLHNWILFGYSEVLLNYAEAMVNAFGNPSYTDSELPVSAVDAVNMIRDRGGVKMPLIPSDISKEEFIVRLKNERRVELAFEGHRFWDIRRWKELDKASQIYSTKVTKDAAGYFKYTKVLYESRPFNEKYYFYPIPNSEIYANSNLKQNPGW